MIVADLVGVGLGRQGQAQVDAGVMRGVRIRVWISAILTGRRCFVRVRPHLGDSRCSIRPRLSRVEHIIAVRVAGFVERRDSLVVADGDVLQSNVSRVGHLVDPSHGGSDGHVRTGCRVSIFSVCELLHINRWIWTRRSCGRLRADLRARFDGRFHTPLGPIPVQHQSERSRGSDLDAAVELEPRHAGRRVVPVVDRAGAGA